MSSDIDQIKTESQELRLEIQNLKNRPNEVFQNKNKNEEELDLGIGNSKGNSKTFSPRLSFTTRSCIKWLARAIFFYSLLSGLSIYVFMIADTQGLMSGYSSSYPQPSSIFIKMLDSILFTRNNPFGVIYCCFCALLALPFLMAGGMMILVVLTAAIMGEAELEIAIQGVKSGEMLRSLMETPNRRN